VKKSPEMGVAMHYRIIQVNYDLSTKHAPEYDKVISTIKENYQWCHPMESCWLLWTSEMPDEVSARLYPCIQQGDWLLVNGFSTIPTQGWLTNEVWDWINERQAIMRGRVASR
jgi:hypothetical protein